MFDSLAYRLRLIDIEEIQAPPFIGHTIPAKEGFSLELFRANEHKASIRPSNLLLRNDVAVHTRFKSQKGDILYSVNLAPQPHTISGTLTTKENYYRLYAITIEMEVRDPVLLVRGLLQGYDFAQIVAADFGTLFQQHTAQMEYDKISSESLPLPRWNGDFSKRYGIQIRRAYRLSLRDDTNYLTLSAIRHQSNLEKAKIKAQIEAIQQQADIDIAKSKAWKQVKGYQEGVIREFDTLKKQHDIIEKRRAKDAIRTEEKQQQMHALNQMLREKAAAVFAEIQSELIREAIESRREVATVAMDVWKLLNAYNNTLQYGEYIDALPASEYLDALYEDEKTTSDKNINGASNPIDPGDTSFSSDHIKDNTLEQTEDELK